MRSRKGTGPLGHYLTVVFLRIDKRTTVPRTMYSRPEKEVGNNYRGSATSGMNGRDKRKDILHAPVEVGSELASSFVPSSFLS